MNTEDGFLPDIILRDRNPAMTAAWEAEFRGVPNVTIELDDIFAPIKWNRVALVSPANSFGFLNGGIDLVYSRRFGPELQNRLQNVLPHGELPVGQAICLYVADLDKEISYFISAPTMRVPMDVTGTVNAYLAFRAALISAVENNIRTLLCPGLCTAIGRMPHEKAARQMREAYAVVIEGKKPHAQTISQAYHANECLRRGLPYDGKDF